MAAPTFNETFRAFVDVFISDVENNRPLDDFIEKGYQFFEYADTVDEQSAVVNMIIMAQLLAA